MDFQALLERKAPPDSQATPASQESKEHEEIPVSPGLPSPDHREFREPGVVTVKVATRERKGRLVNPGSPVFRA